MKVFVTGVNGQLGHDVMLELKGRGFSAIGSGSGKACLNRGGPENIARACAATGAKMVYISTDYVFDGRGERPRAADDTCFAPMPPIPAGRPMYPTQGNTTI